MATPAEKAKQEKKTTNRITRDLLDVQKNPIPGMTIDLPNSNLFLWHITLTGPPSTPFSSGTFGVILTIPPDFPFRPPTVRFATKIFHPNVQDDVDRAVCLPMLLPNRWKPSTVIRGILESLRNLLVEPQPDEPLEMGIAEMYRDDRQGWEKRAREYVELYAKKEVVVFPGPGEAMGGKEKENDKKGDGGLPASTGAGGSGT